MYLPNCKILQKKRYNYFQRFERREFKIGIVFSNPIYLWLLVGIFILIIINHISFGWNRKTALKFSNFDAIVKVTRQTFFPRSFIPLIIRILIIVSIVLSLAGVGFWYTGDSSDLDYILVIDASGSMLATDYEPNRLEAAKNAAMSFVDTVGIGTKIGIVSFAGSSFVDQALTDDKNSIKEAINSVKIISVGGTAIGDAVVLASNIFKISETEDKGRSVILLTDGQSNVGISEEDAIEYASTNGVIINTVGIGTEEGGTFIGDDVVLKLDSKKLEFLAKETGGTFYLVNDEDELKDAYFSLISTSEGRVFFDAKLYLLLFAFLLLILEWILTNTRYKTIV